MKIRAENGEFIIPKEEEHYILFEYPGGVFDIRVTDSGVEIFIPRDIEKTNIGFIILDRKRGRN